MNKNANIERQLLIGLVNGDESSFCELYITYKKQLIYFALGFIKSQEYAEDIYQDAFEAVWHNRKSIDPDLPFGPYIYTIIKNRLLNQLYSLDKDRKLKEIIESRSIPFINETDDTIMYKDLDNLLREALNGLTPQQKKVFDMSRRQMMSHKAIAETLNISVNTVQQHISDSLKTIRNHVQKYGGSYTDSLLLLFCFNLL